MDKMWKIIKEYFLEIMTAIFTICLALIGFFVSENILCGILVAFIICFFMGFLIWMSVTLLHPCNKHIDDMDELYNSMDDFIAQLLVYNKNRDDTIALNEVCRLSEKFIRIFNMYKMKYPGDPLIESCRKCYNIHIQAYHVEFCLSYI